MINSNQTIVSFNCYQNNRTCQLFNNGLNFFRNQLNDELNTSFYFLQYPPRNFTDLLWSFDRSINDESSFVYMTQKGVVSYILPRIYGRGAALVFNGAQYLTASSPYLDTTSNGFTFEMWIYMIGSLLPNQVDLGLVGQCLRQNTGNCLHMSVRKRLPQSIFINGQLDSSVIPSGGLNLNPMTNISLTIGNIQDLVNSQAYHGYLDQLSHSSRPKSSNEILDDATLVFYFAFNSNSFLDSGPNRIIGTPYNVILINDALQFYQSFSSFQIETFIPP
ncbi:unnamed protein product [Adineta ricciae]|uniref:Uncharacterized protein n=1 Tax=Adineta ricciae TaxID=249248 RepID=A0A816F1V6_ADIRI|nr:unnamed protein product [Adineta ricciae]CAF1657026.1 unnamed protein product [Adineta ricciae]